MSKRRIITAVTVCALIVVATAALLTNARQTGGTVEIVIPERYRGLFVVIEDPVDGQVGDLGSGTCRFAVPDTGVLAVRSWRDFERETWRFEFANGVAIAPSHEVDVGEEVIVWKSVATVTGSAYGPGGARWLWIGPKAESHTAGDEIRPENLQQIRTSGAYRQGES